MTKEEEGLLHFTCSPNILDYLFFLHVTGGRLKEELSISEEHQATGRHHILTIPKQQSLFLRVQL